MRRPLPLSRWAVALFALAGLILSVINVTVSTVDARRYHYLTYAVVCLCAAISIGAATYPMRPPRSERPGPGPS